MPKKKDNDHGTKIPPYEILALAETIYPDILKMFENPDIQKEFEEWLKQEENKT